jgi:antibiotic biosynthesis monooxygenase (ABM) superfamily enzyme
VTVVFTRRVTPGREDEYRRWLRGFQEASRSWPGFQGVTTHRSGKREGEFISIARFASAEALHAWEESQLYKEWLARLPADTVLGDASIRRAEGVEFWFTPPNTAAEAPSQHKMALVIFILVVALTTVFTAILKALFPGSPQYIRIILNAIFQVTLLTYVIMPRVTKWLAWWLYSAAKQPARNDERHN